MTTTVTAGGLLHAVGSLGFEPSTFRYGSTVLPYDPFTAPRPDRWSVGLRPVDDAAWLVSGGDTQQQRLEKSRLLRTAHHACVATTGEPEVEDACTEAAELVLATVGVAMPNVKGIHALETAATVVSEDLVVMVRPVGDDEVGAGYVLGAGVVCFPTRWLLTEKVGRPMTAIHAPVPGYEEQIGRATNRVFASMDGRILLRTNWSLLDSGDLHQPSGRHDVGDATAVTSTTAGSTVWVRTERQSLRRLDRSGAVLFTIRVFQCRLDELPREFFPSLSAALARMHDDMRAYKSLRSLDGPVQAWLAAVR